MFIVPLKIVLAIAIVFAAQIFAQTPPPADGSARYLDQVDGMTTDRAVALGLENNGELQAARKEVEALRAMVKQAGLRSNPKLNVGGTKQINGADNSQLEEDM